MKKLIKKNGLIGASIIISLITSQSYGNYIKISGISINIYIIIIIMVILSLIEEHLELERIRGNLIAIMLIILTIYQTKELNVNINEMTEVIPEMKIEKVDWRKETEKNIPEEWRDIISMERRKEIIKESKNAEEAIKKMKEEMKENLKIPIYMKIVIGIVVIIVIRDLMMIGLMTADMIHEKIFRR